jgi:hypothetical protein
MKKLQGSNLRYYPGIYLEGLRKITEASVTIADLRAEILTRDLQIIRYRSHSKISCKFGVLVFQGIFYLRA